jgi:hypothetical protein
VRLSAVRHVPGVAADVARVHQHLMGVVGGSMVLRQVRRLLVVMLRRLVQGGRSGMAQRGSVVMAIVGVGRRLALLARMRLLW